MPPMAPREKSSCGSQTTPACAKPRSFESPSDSAKDSNPSELRRLIFHA